MSGDTHVQFWESLGVRFPGATQQMSDGGLRMAEVNPPSAIRHPIFFYLSSPAALKVSR